MLWLIFAMLSILGVVGILDSPTMIGGLIQITLISALVLVGINRLRAVSTQIRRSQVG
jgi:hypothetical protein